MANKILTDDELRNELNDIFARLYTDPTVDNYMPSDAKREIRRLINDQKHAWTNEVIGKDEKLPNNPLGLPAQTYSRIDIRNQIRSEQRKLNDLMLLGDRDE